MAKFAGNQLVNLVSIINNPDEPKVLKLVRASVRLAHVFVFSFTWPSGKKLHVKLTKLIPVMLFISILHQQRGCMKKTVKPVTNQEMKSSKAVTDVLA